MKRFDKREEFERMQKVYENSAGVHESMDLQAFAWNYYNGQVKKFTELRNFWTFDELRKFFDSENPCREIKQSKPDKPEKKKLVVKVKRA